MKINNARLHISTFAIKQIFTCRKYLLHQNIFLWCLCAYLVISPSKIAHASGFQIFEQNASSTATSGANQAEAKDASAIFWNPAALTLLPGNQFSGAVHLIRPSGYLSETSGQTSIGPTPISGNNGGDPGVLTPAATAFYSSAVSPGTTIGLSVTAPFGLTVKYDEGWIGRYNLLNGSLLAVDFGASVGYKATPSISLGLGLDLQYAKTKLGNAIDLSTACLGTSLFVSGLGAQCVGSGFAAPGNLAADGRVDLEQDSWSTGWNAGILWHPSPEFRVGLAYRSKVSHNFHGSANFSKPAALPVAVATLPSLSNTAAQTRVVLPESVSASIFYQLNRNWSVMGAATWARWSRFNQIQTRFENGAADLVIPLDWENTWRISAAIGYQVTSSMTLRAGAVFDPSPTTSARSPTLLFPDQDRHAFSLGGTYALNESTSIEFGAIRYQVNKVSINQNSAATGSFSGTFPNISVTILSLQANHRF